jgi:hypothetical protein
LTVAGARDALVTRRVFPGAAARHVEAFVRLISLGE